MNKNGSSEHHQNNNLKVVMAFDNFLGKGDFILWNQNKGTGFRIFRHENQIL